MPRVRGQHRGPSLDARSAMLVDVDPDSRPAHTAVCWDLDGTLLDAGPLGMDVVRSAFTTVTGLTSPGPMPGLAGRTDWLLGEALRDALPPRDRARVTADNTFGPRMMDAIAAGWAGREGELAGVAVALPGAREALDALAAVGGVVQTVATGNVEHSARVKLAAVGLAGPPLDLDCAGFGDRPGPRVGILHAARERLEARHGTGLAMVVVGDTMRDVEAAHAFGALSVGVATGPLGVAELADAGADVVLSDLADPAPLVAVVRHATQDGGRGTRGSV